MNGTFISGVENEKEAALQVRGMFARIAPRYDLLNHLLSGSIDRFWRRKTVQALAGPLSQPGVRVLDLCCGTGDLASELSKRTQAFVIASDFCHPMLLGARRKLPVNSLLEADALCMPLTDASVDVVTCAFGFRNLANYDTGLREMRRLLRPGGVLAILEFSRPPNPFLAAVYRFYSSSILPRIGGFFSGSRQAYTYLPESVDRFPSASALAQRIQVAGFSEVRFIRMTFGVVALHLATRTH